ncbi:MAG: DCC1-like thiol-disulfide oxidoreductase family protein [Chloroflexi bacterium]|nr:DCC1-like thiol-disulfide oxidoreductase family protein [Chloroflexota bacterium]MDA1145300.1 DCC1-like thiol-disulfide oxidoreductase family protein [Chloroflexota bacterium]
MKRLGRIALVLALCLAVPAAVLEAAAWILGRRATRSRIAPGRPLLVYDNDCGLCTIVALFCQARTPGLALVGFSELPREGILESLDWEAVLASAHLVTADGVEYHGGEAVTQLLRLGTVGPLVAWLDWPVLRGLREIGYRLVVWQRASISRVLRAG